MESLPVEINCRIFENLTDPYQIVKLLQSNLELASIAKDCITRLSWDRQMPIPASFVSQFNNIRVVDMPISINNDDELMSLAKLKLRKASFLISYWRIFNLGVEGSAADNILTIRDWYSARMRESGKSLTFFRSKGDYLTIKDHTLDYSLSSGRCYDILYPLMKAIDSMEGLYTITGTNWNTNIIMEHFKHDFPNVKNLIYSGKDYINLNLYFEYTNVNKVLFPVKYWTDDHIDFMTWHVTDLLVGNIGNYNGVWRANEVIDKEIYLEIPVYPNWINRLRLAYPNIRQLAVYIDEAEYSNSTVYDLSTAELDDINVIIYTKYPEILPEILPEIVLHPNINVRKIID